MLLLNNPIPLVGSFLLLAVIPLVVMGLTSFIKISVVLGLLRNAIGAQQVPSSAITTLLALALTLHVMAPVMRETENVMKAEGSFAEGIQAKSIKVDQLFHIVGQISVPLQGFLQKNSRSDIQAFFSDHREESASKDETIAGVPGDKTISFLDSIPAFIITELSEAFTIGILLFLPFLIVDVVIANILVGMGMMMVSPVTISLPLKLLLFVSCDGWFLICQSLIRSY